MHRTYKSDAIIIGFGNLSNLDDCLSKYEIPNYHLRYFYSIKYKLDELNTLRREAEEKEIIRAVRRSGKSFQEVMRLIRL